MRNYKEERVMFMRILLCIVLIFLGYGQSGLIAQNEPQQKSKTVFLTGAAGFIGSNFLRYMFDKYPHYNFIVLDALTYAGNMENIPDYIKNSNRFEFVYDTVTNQEVVDACMKRADFVVHFAAESHVTRSLLNPRTFVDTDVMGTLTMLHSLVKHKNVQRFIHISTSEVYGTAETEPITEEHPLNPRSPYAAAKAGADRLVWAYYCTYNVPVVIIRPFNNYGPNQHLEKVIPRFITHAIKGKPLTVHGDGSAKRDWLHVLDTCEGLDKALHVENFESIKGQAINLGTGVSTSVREIADIITQEFGMTNNGIVNQQDRPGQVACHISSTDKAERLLGWKAKRNFKESFKDVINWYKANQGWWQRLEMMQWVPVQVGADRVEKQ
jgi:dTDP-glucose 4,6-dehydratase